MNIIIDVKNTNDKPRINDQINVEGKELNVEAQEGKEFEHSLKNLFVDVDDKKLKLILVTAPEWVNIEQESELLKGIPTLESEGSHEIVIRAEDWQGDYAERKLNIHVKNTNQPPRVGELIDIPETSQGQILLYRLPGRAFIDNDMNEQIGDSLTYTLEGTDDVKVPPEWLRINKVDGTISGKPGNNNVEM